MKKSISVFVALVVLLSLFSGCTGQTAEEEKLRNATKIEDAENQDQDFMGVPSYEEPAQEPAEKPASAQNGFDEESVINSLTVEMYDYVDSIQTQWAFLVIKNNSEYDLSIHAAVKTYDADGKLIGAKDRIQDAFEKGTEVILPFMFDENFSSLEYDISAEEEELFECVVSDLSIEDVPAKNKEIISVTNNGAEPAQFIEGTILFFRDGEVVYWNSTYFVDDDYELKPGDTITKELDSFEKYDAFKVCFTGSR